MHTKAAVVVTAALLIQMVWAQPPPVISNYFVWNPKKSTAIGVNLGELSWNQCDVGLDGGGTIVTFVTDLPVAKVPRGQQLFIRGYCQPPGFAIAVTGGDLWDNAYVFRSLVRINGGNQGVLPISSKTDVGIEMALGNRYNKETSIHPAITITCAYGSGL